VSFFATREGMRTILARFGAGMLLHLASGMVMACIGFGPRTVAALASGCFARAACSWLGLAGSIRCSCGRLCIPVTSAASSLGRFCFTVASATNVRLFHLFVFLRLRRSCRGLGRGSANNAHEGKKGEELFHAGMVGFEVRS